MALVVVTGCCSYFPSSSSSGSSSSSSSSLLFLLNFVYFGLIMLYMGSPHKSKECCCSDPQFPTPDVKNHATVWH